MSTPTTYTPWSVSVRELAETVWRAGNLSQGHTLGPSAQDGMESHKWYQTSRKPPYEAEVSLSEIAHRHHVALNIRGRADGIYPDADPVIIEEIKTTATQPLLLDGENPVHWAQAKLYGAMLAEARKLEAVIVRLTYIELGTRAIRRFEKRLSAAELGAFFDDTVERFAMWIARVVSWRRERDQHLKALVFPFQTFRPGQRELAKHVFHVSDGHAGLFAEAPTGSGKTMGVLFGALKALGEGRVSQVVFLTAKTVGRNAAVSAMKTVHESGAPLKTLCLTAKQRLCRASDCTCDAASCVLAKGHFDRLSDAVDALFERPALLPDDVERVAAIHRVCPYWLSREMVPWADVVICDYNYVFDPRAALAALIHSRDSTRICLIDEAHNLVERAREMFSAAIDTAPITTLSAALPRGEQRLAKGLGRLDDIIRRMWQRHAPSGTGSVVLDTLPASLKDALADVCELAEQTLAGRARSTFFDALRQLYFECLTFGKTAFKKSERDTTYLQRNSNGHVKVKRLCLDPAPRIRHILDDARLARVCFSATLSPIRYYSRMLGGGEDDIARVFESPFSKGQLFSGIVRGVSTRYRHREETAARIGDIIIEGIRAKQGNYMAYFPSYRYLDLVARYFFQKADGVDTVTQAANESESDKRAFLDAFERPRDRSLLGFAVLGGRYGEGIDLAGSRLVGAFIISPGLPKASIEREVIRGYHEARDGSGFDFAYRYPGMNKVVQAAGRVIRTEVDTGVTLFIGERFGNRAYRSLLPGQVAKTNDIVSPAELKRKLRVFWSASQKATAARVGHVL